MIRRLWGLRWWMIGLITVGTILNYLTRTMLGVAAPTLMGELGITEKEYSWVTGFFQVGIMLQPIVGYVMDHHRPEAGLRPVRAGVGRDHDVARRG